MDPLFSAAIAWAARAYPGQKVLEVRLVIDGVPRSVRLPVPLSGQSGTSAFPADAHFQHSADYRSVACRGEAFTFTPAQAAIVQALHEAHRNKTPDLSQATLLELAGCETSNRVRDLFRVNNVMHPAWGTLIVPAPTGKGLLRLNLTQPAPLPAILVAKHSPDFRSINWHGTVYGFTEMQAACVRLLWAAWEEGTLDVEQGVLLSAAGTESVRISEVFRGNPAWGGLIIQGATRGTYRLTNLKPSEEN
jgi:hypothetical protein